ncbi:HAD-IIB family hydrolase [Sporosarcina sp. 179-K 3D1 HS]|uniref:HAD-IIB family hydrolase n=1 Tax=Sporosarcina sp. 179-K 3D1 HS TaxID=3232169 RepID=UPI0039A1EB80
MKSKTHMLATDLDGTLVGDEEALRSLLKYYEEQPYDVSFIYVTGRHLSSALLLIEEEGLPVPDILISDVGASIYVGKHFNEDAEWAKRMQANWDPVEIAGIVARFPELKRQLLPNEKRVSYTMENGDERTVYQVEEALIQEKLPHKLIVSSNRDVDILPMKSGKGEALQYVIDTYANDNVQVLIAGDSGNDLDMLSLDYPSVIVGNAQEELAILQPDPLLYRATSHCAGGIQEAWMHFYEKMNTEPTPPS